MKELYEVRAIEVGAAKDAMLLKETPTLRDQFAIAVLQGNCTTNWGEYFIDQKALARHCYSIADAMLEVRKEGN